MEPTNIVWICLSYVCDTCLSKVLGHWIFSKHINYPNQVQFGARWSVYAKCQSKIKEISWNKCQWDGVVMFSWCRSYCNAKKKESCWENGRSQILEKNNSLSRSLSPTICATELHFSIKRWRSHRVIWLSDVERVLELRFLSTERPTTHLFSLLSVSSHGYPTTLWKSCRTSLNGTCSRLPSQRAKIQLANSKRLRLMYLVWVVMMWWSMTICLSFHLVNFVRFSFSIFLSVQGPVCNIQCAGAWSSWCPKTADSANVMTHGVTTRWNYKPNNSHSAWALGSVHPYIRRFAHSRGPQGPRSGGRSIRSWENWGHGILLIFPFMFSGVTICYNDYCDNWIHIPVDAADASWSSTCFL